KAEYDDDTEIKVDKHGKTVEIQYSDNTILIMNLGNHNHEIDLQKKNLIFNSDGKKDISQRNYTLRPLELVVLKNLSEV
ncbi:MAG: hypothetical protein JEY91_18645, partial [Spirochaetaceae bacterium]|nr:hypothetical protein [Spirochaetaceae bacterium]